MLLALLVLTITSEKLKEILATDVFAPLVIENSSLVERELWTCTWCQYSKVTHRSVLSRISRPRSLDKYENIPREEKGSYRVSNELLYLLFNSLHQERSFKANFCVKFLTRVWIVLALFCHIVRLTISHAREFENCTVSDLVKQSKYWMADCIFNV